jgi:hypothetical protein
MTFTDIPARASVFVDANTLVYYFVPEPVLGPACRDLLERFATQELVGFTSAHVLSNVAHRIMTLEAVDRFGWRPSSRSPCRRSRCFQPSRVSWQLVRRRTVSLDNSRRC